MATFWEHWLAQQILGLARPSGNRCWLYYNQPRRYPWCLTLQYIVSARDTTFRTSRLAVELLDEVARIKHIDTLLCDVSNARTLRSLVATVGAGNRTRRCAWHRNYVKRLYQLPLAARRCQLECGDLLAACERSSA